MASWRGRASRVWWSIAGDRSWDALAKGIVLLAVGVVGLTAGLLPGRPLRTLALLLAGLIGAVLLWALLGKVLPGLGPDDASRVARLRGSIGYWNALALVGDAALGLGLWLLVAVRERFARPGGAILVYLAVLVILLTQSRAGLLAGIAVVAVTLWLSEGRVEAALLGLLSGGPAIVVAGWAFTRPALVDDGGAHADRVADGRLLGVMLVVGGIAALALVALVPVDRLVSTRRRDVVRGLVGATALVLVVGVIGLVASVGNPFTWAGDQLSSSGEVANGSTHLGSLETNNRTVWWGEAWRVFRAHPAGGTGANTFEIARKRVRDNAQNVTEPHSLPLQLLSDSGLPGLALAIVLVIGLGLGIRASVRRLDPGERGAAVGLLALPLAFGLHALVDFDLDFLAIVVPTALVSAALLAAGRPRAVARSRGLIAVSASLVAVAAVWVIASPALSSRVVDRAYRQCDAGDLAAAAASARRAQSLNPLSPEPLYARATIASRRATIGLPRRSTSRRRGYSPRTPRPGTQLGVFRQIALRNECSAYFAFNAAFTLDPKSSLFFAGGPLDQARNAVNDPEHPACGR